jgi:4-hydroxy-3-methylbut-2-enyl diphosphate reductase
MTSCFFLCPLPPEAAAARAGIILHAYGEGRRAPGVAGAAPAGVRVVGMGPARASSACDRLAANLPPGVPVVVLGVGGALVSGLVPGDLVVAAAIGFADVRPGGDELEVIRAPQPLDWRSAALGSLLGGALQERFATTQRAAVLTTRRTVRGTERARLAKSGAVMCDTESVSLMRLAEQRPFAVVRAVVDGPERELLSLQTISGGMRGLRRLTEAAAIIAGVLEAQPALPAQPYPSEASMSPT